MPVLVNMDTFRLLLRQSWQQKSKSNIDKVKIQFKDVLESHMNAPGRALYTLLTHLINLAL